MDTGTILLIVVVVFAIVLVIALFRPWKRFRGSVTGPAGTRVDLELSNEPMAPGAGVRMEKVKAGRDVEGQDATGGGVAMKDVEADRDVRATSDPSPGQASPKA